MNFRITTSQYKAIVKALRFINGLSLDENLWSRPAYGITVTIDTPPSAKPPVWQRALVLQSIRLLMSKIRETNEAIERNRFQRKMEKDQFHWHVNDEIIGMLPSLVDAYNRNYPKFAELIPAELQDQYDADKTELYRVVMRVEDHTLDDQYSPVIATPIPAIGRPKRRVMESITDIMIGHDQ